MKILYVTTVGATMTFFKDFFKELISNGHTVDLACNEKEWDYGRYIWIEIKAVELTEITNYHGK